MSSVLSEYPETLPAPMVGVVVPTERRRISNLPGVQNFRTVQRDRHGTRTYAFTFTRAQAAIFREWWAEWEQRGGGWFAANWPLPWSRGPNVFRFKATPSWEMIGGGNDGQGYWRVSGTVEIRGRGMLPTVEVMYLTSTPYPIVSTDSMSAKAGNVRAGPGIQDYSEAIGSEAIIIDITARDIFNIYNFPPEAIGTLANVIGISSTTSGPQKIEMLPEAISIMSSVLTISSYIGLVTYQNYKPEAISISSSVVSISSTGT